MDETYFEVIDDQVEDTETECNLNITEYHPEYSILNDRSEKSSSGVWKHFGTLKHNDAVDRKHVYCIQCFIDRKIKKYQRSTSTGNLSKHLKKHHSISLGQTFRIKKESDNSIISIQKEDDYDYGNDSNKIKSDEENINSCNADASGEEFLINDINEILIAEVAKRPMLYNSMACKHEMGMKQEIRRQLWSEIYESLNHLIPYGRLPKIWKNIRDRYHKIRRSVDKNGTDVKPKYRYYELLRFLDPIDEQKEANVSKGESSPMGERSEEVETENYVDEFIIINDSETNNYMSRSSETIHLHSEKNVFDDEIYEPKRKKSKLPAVVKIKESYHSINPTKNLPNGNHRKHKLNKIKTVQSNKLIKDAYTIATSNDANDQILLELDDDVLDTETVEPEQSEQKIELPSQKLDNSKKSDEFDIFGNFMAEIMRNMTKVQARKLQMNILEIITETENAQ